MLIFSDPRVVLIMGGGIVFGLALTLAWQYLLVRLVRREVVEPVVQAQRQSWTIARSGPGLPSGRKLLTGPEVPDTVDGEYRELSPFSRAPGGPRG